MTNRTLTCIAVVDDDETKEEHMETTPVAVAKQSSGLSIVWSILLIVFGVLAICSPLAASLGVMLVIAWLILFGGVAQLAYAFQSEGIGHIIWKLLVAFVYIAAGLYLLTHPGVGVAGLTLVLGIVFFVEGVADVILYFSVPKVDGSGWVLFDGIITLILGVMIWRGWPSTSFWVIGTLVGISMIMTGTTRLMMSLAVRKLAKAL